MGNRGKNSFRILACVAIVTLGVIGGWLLGQHRAYTVKYSLLDPAVENPNVAQGIVDFDDLRQNVKAYLEKVGIDHSFYFEYLPNGVNIRDGSDEEAVGASLLKTPLVMDLYRLAEAGKVDLESTVKIEVSDISSDVVYGDPSGLSEGQTISLKNAARIALQKSDNTAISLVRRTVQPLITKDTDVFQSLDVTYTVKDDTSMGSNSTSLSDNTVFISARSYSSILKCLYYACFLSPSDSQEILQMLIGSAGQNRLPSGVPASVQVAHKIGSSLTGDSDCGIFYAPKKPYLVCLIFRGNGTEKPSDTDENFQHISRMVYDYVTSKN